MATGTIRDKVQINTRVDAWAVQFLEQHNMNTIEEAKEAVNMANKILDMVNDTRDPGTGLFATAFINKAHEDSNDSAVREIQDYLDKYGIDDEEIDRMIKVANIVENLIAGT